MADKVNWSSRSIQGHVGRFILLKFCDRYGISKELTGVILETNMYFITFNVNKSGKKVPIRYECIVDIVEPEKV